MYTGESCTFTFSLLLSRSTREKPTAAKRKPEVVCSMVSQYWYLMK